MNPCWCGNHARHEHEYEHDPEPAPVPCGDRVSHIWTLGFIVCELPAGHAGRHQNEHVTWPDGFSV